MDKAIYIKPLATGAIATVLDKYVLKQPDMTKSLYFGGAVAVGTGLAVAASPMIPQFVPSVGEGIDGKTLSHRVIEVGFGAGSTWVLNKYILKNEIPREQMLPRLGVILAADCLGEYAKDYFMGETLSYLA